MKSSFKAIIGKNSITLLDAKDKRAYEALFFAVLENSKVKGTRPIVEVTFEIVEKTLSEKQKKLWQSLLSIMANETGNDTSSIERAVLEDFPVKKNLEEFTTFEFQNLLLFATEFAHSFLNINIVYENERFTIKK